VFSSPSIFCHTGRMEEERSQCSSGASERHQSDGIGRRDNAKRRQWSLDNRIADEPKSRPGSRGLRNAQGQQFSSVYQTRSLAQTRKTLSFC
jgi:hypothetical protein